MGSVFSLLNPNIQELLKQNNIDSPTEPQKKAIPSILKGENVLLIAPTGHGKTESALLPIFHNFLKHKTNSDNSEKGISIIYITPLRALNRDMLKRTIDWGKNLGIKIAVRHGDTPQSERTKQSKNPPDMLITTPETFQIMFIGKRLRKNMETIRWVVVDEIHELANDERGWQLSVGIERLYELTKQNNHSFQRIGLSATVGTPLEVSKYLGGFENQKDRSVKTIQVDISRLIDINVEYPDTAKKDYADAKKLSIEPNSYASLKKCKELIEKHDSTLLFINTRDGAEILTSRFYLLDENLKIDVHHGSLSKTQRIQAEDNFKQGNLKSLICTSSLELGIDVGNTDFVIQYNSPREVKRLLQRIGRSGHRIGKTSKGTIIAVSPEDLTESIVIAKKALKGEIEPIKIRQNPLSVLTNQIISIALEYGKIHTDKIYQILKRTYPFHSLDKKTYEKIIQQLTEQRNIWMEDHFIGRKRNSRNYFLDNISMIPDEKTYMAVDISSRKKIGKLDENFVLNIGYEGTNFILSGRPWNIVKIEDDEILISQAKEIGNAPSWTGEDIPIPYEVAREVGKIRRTLQKNQKIDYPCSKKDLQKIQKQITNQTKQGYIVPDDQNITIEIEDKTIVINACFGTKVNETLARIITAILVQNIGESIGINSDAYRINLELPGRIKPEMIKEIIYNIKPETIWYILNTIIRNSNFIRGEIVHVARKFGALRKDFEPKHTGMKKLFNLFENTLIFDETIDKIIHERMDIENTQKILEKTQQKQIKIHIQRLSPMSLAGLDTIRGLMVPQRADRSILMALKKRIEETEITMICTNCKHRWNTTVKRANEKPQCPKCKAIKIAAVRRYNQDFAKLLSKKNRNSEEEKEVKRIHKNASLVLSYGRPALFALMGRGIGPDTAARILRRYNMTELFKNEEKQIKFLRDILKSELNYARTRGFWNN